MNTLLIITVIYILNVFLNRYLNKVAYKKRHINPFPQLWFVPIIPLFAFIYIIYLDGFFEKDNWFNGKHW